LIDIFIGKFYFKMDTKVFDIGFGHVIYRLTLPINFRILITDENICQ